MSRTQENFAANMVHNRRRSSGGQQQDGEVPDKPLRIYGSANRMTGGAGQDIDDLSDWELQSHITGRSAISQFSQINARKVKGLETIYL